MSASAHTREVLARQENFTVTAFLQTLHYQQPSDTEHVREGLLKRSCRLSGRQTRLPRGVSPLRATAGRPAFVMQ